MAKSIRDRHRSPKTISGIQESKLGGFGFIKIGERCLRAVVREEISDN
jgi:hypothetical protein